MSRIQGKLGHAPDGSKRIGQLKHEHREWADAQPTITRCAVDGCTWTFEGEAADGREMFLAHRRLRHGFGMDNAGPEPTQEALQTSGDPDLDQIRDLLGHGQEVEIRLPREPQPWRRDWIESLGGRIVIDPEAPMPIALQHDRKDGPVNADEGRSALDAMDRGEAQRPSTNGAACKIDGCGEPPVNAMGRWAKLCKAHKAEAVAAARAEGSLGSRYGSGQPEPEPEPAPLPVPAAPPEPPAPSPVAADPEHVDVFELFETMATEERIEFYERQAAAAQAKAEALKQIREALDGVREPA